MQNVNGHLIWSMTNKGVDFSPSPGEKAENFTNLT